jgi:hypothetical protein
MNELKDLVNVAETVGDTLSETQDKAQGFMLIVNHGQTSTTAVVGTSECLASALYTSCKSSKELTMIIMAVAGEIVEKKVLSRELKFNGEDIGNTESIGVNSHLMGPKGDA